MAGCAEIATRAFTRIARLAKAVNMPKQTIGFARAFEQTMERIHPGDPVGRPLLDCAGYVTAEQIFALVDSPSSSTSLKDGYALCAVGSRKASGTDSQPLPVVGSVAAGQADSVTLKPGTACRILTGARLPGGADRVVAEEFVTRAGDTIVVTKPTAKGRNILSRGSDTEAGELLLAAGRRLTPGRIGLLAAGGHHLVRVYRKPVVALIATGDEVLLPGERLSDGKLYASNLMTLHSWCRQLGLQTCTDVIGDNFDSLRDHICKRVAKSDAIITSGGAWSGEKDLMAAVLNDLGWTKVYHRVRLGPGKAVGFGLLKGKPVFILPGGPPSNLVAFLQLALPGLQKLCGQRNPGLDQVPAVLGETVSGQSDWTQAIFGELQQKADALLFRPHGRSQSRLSSMAAANALLLIPEGVSNLSENLTVKVQVLNGMHP
jgi:molybdopterin molybdotransferase